ncbi:3419_t:CDS:2 [Entrophospora sp. SA101]|nr:3419_t:CDS:2 [Entrophospora sp. SA101]
MTIYRGIYIPVNGPPENPLATRLIYQRMGRDDLPPIRGPVVLVDDYRKLSLKDLRKLLKIPYNREQIENTSRKMLEDVQAFLKRQQDTKDYTSDHLKVDDNNARSDPFLAHNNKSYTIF